MIDSGDTAWILVSTALVMVMTPGVGLFYGGMVRRKNAVALISLSLISLVIVGIQWIVVGYSLSFGSDVGGFIGDLSYFFLNNIGFEPFGDTSIPHMVFVIYQMMFAIVTLAILVSAIAERSKLEGFIVFGLLWIFFVYNPFAHWLWGGGWLSKLGALDFAGGMVVHVSSGFSALALAMVIGKRREFGEVSIEPHNIPLTLLGGALLWFGWFGFNGGSALAADGLAANAIVVTNVAAMVAAAVWMFAAWAGGKPGSLSIVSGAIAGLAAVTPAAGFIDVKGAVIIGLIAGILCYKAMDFRIKAGLDESLDAWAIHGIGGLWGSFAVALLANKAINDYAGLFYGNPELVIPQTIAVVATVSYAFVVTYVLGKLVDSTIGLRVSEEEEYVGLDISQHGEVAYA
jgi:Amt family ammonium transporter